MNVTLVDLGDSRGHHLFYATILVDYLRGKGIKVSFVGPDEFARLLQPIPFVGIGRMGDAGFKHLVKTRRHINRAVTAVNDLSPDVVHWLTADRTLIPLASTRHRDVATVLTLHWAYMMSRFSTFPASLKNPLEIQAMRRLTKRGAHAVVHFDEFARLLAEHGIGSSVVPYPVRKPAERSPLPAGRLPTLLCFGGMRFDKGTDIAVRILSHLPSNYRLRVVGEAASFSKRDVQRIASSLGVWDRVDVIADHIPDEQIPEVFRAADVVLLPYRRIFAGESGPLGLAASMGRPVAATSLPQFKSTIERFRLGAVFEVEDPAACARVVLDVRRGFAPLTEEYLRERSPERFGQTMLDLYSELLGKRSETSVSQYDGARDGVTGPPTPRAHGSRV